MHEAPWLADKEMLGEVEAEKQIQGWGRRGTATQFCNPKKHATVAQIQSRIQLDRALFLEIDTSIEFAETGYSMYQLEVQEACQSFSA